MVIFMCQCPLGLIPHCYKSNHILPSGRKELCQCPLGLIPHCYSRRRWPGRYAIRLPCQCPLGLIPHCYGDSNSSCRKDEEKVSMPSRAYTSLLQYPFKNLGFMRFPEPVFAGICQNILTVTVFRAC